MTSKEDARIRALVQNATRPEVVVPLVLRADIARQIDELEEQLLEIRREKLDTLAGDPRGKEIADQIEALIAEAKDSTIKVTIRGLRRKLWSDMKTRYPTPDPQRYLYDFKLFEEAVPACWAEPEIEDDTRDSMLAEITDGQWERLCAAVQHANGDVDVPFSALATRIRQASAESE